MELNRFKQQRNYIKKKKEKNLNYNPFWNPKQAYVK